MTIQSILGALTPRGFRSRPLRQRFLISLLGPMILGFVVLVVIGRAQVRNSELRVVASEQNQIAESISTSISSFVRTLPENVITLTNSAALSGLLEAQYMMTDPELSGQNRFAVTDQLAKASTDLAAELFQFIRRSTTFQTVSVFDQTGQEILRVERAGPNNVTRIALPNELRSLAGLDYYQQTEDLQQYEISVSAPTYSQDNVVVHMTARIFYRGAVAGGVTIDLQANSFLDYVSGPAARQAMEPGFRYVLVDSNGQYLADTADPGDLGSADYSGHLLGRGTNSANLGQREAELATLLGTTQRGTELVDHIATTITFNPFPFELANTPWTLLIVEDTAIALGNVEHFGWLFALVSVAVLAALLGVQWIVSVYLVRPLNNAVEAAVRVTEGDLSARVPVEADDEIGRLAKAINSMTDRLQAMFDSLQVRFTERTRDLEVASQIAGYSTEIEDIRHLLTRTVDLIRDRFEFYHVQVFLVDRDAHVARLVASTGDAGRTMLDLNWALEIGSDSVIGQVTAIGQTVIALDTGASEVVHRPNPHLPETRSEMATPLRYGDEVVGALDVQSREPNAFTGEDVRIFEILANQLAIALSNARLLETTRQQVSRVEELNRRLTRVAWDDFMEVEQAIPSEYAPQSNVTDAARDVSTNSLHLLSTPLTVRGEVIGTLNSAPAGGGQFGQDEIALIQAVAERVSLAVENARLVTETQRSLMETERLYQSGQAINSSTSERELLQALYKNFPVAHRAMSLSIFTPERDATGNPRQARVLTLGQPGLDGIHEQTLVMDEILASFQAQMHHMLVLDRAEIAEFYPEAMVKAALETGLEVLASFPLEADGVLLGHLSISHYAPYEFNAREAEIFDALSAQIGTVLRSRQLFATAENERKTLQSILSAMPTAVMVIDAHSHEAILANDRAVELLGAQINLQTLFDEGHLIRTDSEEPYPLAEIPVFQALTTGEVSFSEDLSIVSNGRSIDVLNNAAPIRDAAGNVTAVVAVFEDITELRELQGALQDTLRETTAMYEASKSIFGAPDLPTITETALTHLAMNLATDTTHLLMLQPGSGPLMSRLQTLGAFPPADPPASGGLPYPEACFQLDRGLSLSVHDRTLRDADRGLMTLHDLEVVHTIPLRVAGETIGWLAYGFQTYRDLTEDEIRLVEALADQSAVSVQNARLKQQTEAALNQTVLLYNASREIARANTIPEVLDVFVAFALPEEASQAAILLAEGPAELRNLEIGAVWGHDPEQARTVVEQILMHRDSVFQPQVFEQEEPYIVEDFAVRAVVDDLLARQFEPSQAPAVVALLPMVVAGRFLGFVQISYGQTFSHGETLLRNYQALTDQVASAVENRRLFERTQESLDETRVLYETSSAIADVNDPQGILQAIVTHATPPEITLAQLLTLHGTDWDVPGAAISIAATWSREDGPDLSGMRFTAEQYPGWEDLAANQLLHFDDIETDLRLSEDSRLSYLALDIHALAIVPLEIGGKPLGALLFGSGQRRPHDERELRIYANLAELATISLENARLLAQTQSRARQLQTSAEVSRAVTSMLDIGELLPKMVDLIRDNFGYDHVQVFLLDSNDTQAVLQASTGEVGRMMLDMHWALEVGSDSVIGQVTRLAEPVVALDTADAKVPHRPNPYLPDTRSELAVPLVSRGRVVGALDVQSNLSGAFDTEEVTMLSSLADQIAIALDNANLFEETQNYTLALSEQVNNLESLLDASQDFSTLYQTDEILQAAARYMVELMGIDHCGIVIAADDRPAVGRLRAEYPPSDALGTEISMVSSWWTPGSGSGQPYVVEDVANTDQIDPQTREALLALNIQQMILLPFLTSGDRLIGSIGLDLYSMARQFSSEDLTLLQLFATQIASAYQNAQLFQGQQEAALALEQQVMRMERLYSTSLALTETLDLQALLNTGLDGLVQTLGVDVGNILMADAEDFADNPFYIDLISTGAPSVILDVASSDRFTAEVQDYLIETHVQSVILAPLFVHDKLIGAFALSSLRTREFAPAELTLVQTLTTQVSLAYENAELFSQAQRQAEDMSFLFNATTAAAAYSDIEGSMEGVSDLIKQNIPSEAVAVYLVERKDKKDDHLRRVALVRDPAGLHGMPEIAVPERIPLNSNLIELADAERKPFLVGDLRQKPLQGMPITQARSLAGVPLFFGSELIGVLTLLRSAPNAFNEANLRVLQALSSSLSAVVQNIRLLTEVRAANERLRELDKIKSQFLANMSHELRTPLNSIIGFSRVILKGIDGPLSDMQTQDLTTIHSSGQHLLNLINDILDQAKIEAEKLTLSAAWFDIKAAVEVAKSMSIGLLKEKQVRLNIELDAALPQVWGDEVRTRQVMLNLLSNSAKFTFEGSITISVFNVEREDGPYVQVSVADTGIGIPDDKLDVIFRAFEQVDGSLTRTSGGTGLGLPISRSLIEMQGGELWVESTTNVGSTFSFTVPAYAKESEATEQETPDLENDPLKSEAQLPLAEQPLPPRKVVLVIDDEVGMHHLYRRYLNKAGYTVEATSNPEQAEEIARLVNPHAILLDVRMPNRDGWDVLTKLKASAETRPIPVLVCSIDPDADRAFQLGAAAYLNKPFLEEDLLKALEDVELESPPLPDAGSSGNGNGNGNGDCDRILIIDDKPETIRLISQMLSIQPNLKVLTAESGDGRSGGDRPAGPQPGAARPLPAGHERVRGAESPAGRSGHAKPAGRGSDGRGRAGSGLRETARGNRRLQ